MFFNASTPSHLSGKMIINSQGNTTMTKSTPVNAQALAMLVGASITTAMLIISLF